MSKLVGFIVGGLASWIFGPFFAGFLGDWWFVGMLLPFLVGYSFTASTLQAVFQGMVREGFLSSARLRPLKGFAADVLVWLLTLWLAWHAYLIFGFLFPTVTGWYLGLLWKVVSESPAVFPLILGCLALGIVSMLSDTVKVMLGRISRPFRTLFLGLAFGRGGSSKFNGLLAEWDSRWKPGMILLGTSLHSRYWRIGVKDDRHFISIATSRSGKGRSSIIPNLLTWPGSVLVIDPKGQNAAVTMAARKKMGQDVYVVDPFRELENVGFDPQYRFRFNPLSELRPDDLDIVEQCGLLADALIKPDPRAAAFWLNSAKKVLAGLIAHVLTSPKIADDQRTLATMRRLLPTLGQPNSTTLADMRDNDQAGGLPMIAAADIDQLSADAKSDVLGTAAEQTTWLNSLAMRDALGASEFTLADLKKKEMTVYLVLPPAYLDEHGRFLRLFVNLSLNVASKGRKPRHSVLFVLDEFYSLGPINLLSKSAGLLAGFGVKLWPIVQNLGQLKELYPDNWETFLGNAGLWQVFAANDETTARYFSERLGHHVAWRKIRGQTGEQEWVPQGATWLRTSVEFAQESSRESGNQVVFREGGSAFLLRRAPYDSMFTPEEYSPDPFEAPPPWWRRGGGLKGFMTELDKQSGNILDLPGIFIDQWKEHRRRQRKSSN